MAELKDPDPFSFEAKGIELELRRYRNPGKPKVLLLHGASACHHTFLYPNDLHGITGYLFNKGFEPWLLDWCGSNRVLDKYRQPGKWVKGRFDFDHAAEFDLPLAIDKINSLNDSGVDAGLEEISLLGFCMGGAVIAQSIAAGHLASRRVGNVVLMTIGLFYKSTPEGQFKAQARVLDRMLADQGWPDRYIDPRCHKGTRRLENDWHGSFDALYRLWSGNLRPHPPHQVSQQESVIHVLEQCNRVTFMFGEPYAEGQLVPDLHGSSDEIRKQFGAIALRMYAQAAQNVVRGWAAKMLASGSDENEYLQQKARDNFDRLKRITLITGNENRLWSRESIDSMHDWLLRGSNISSTRIKRHILRGYGHQDLLWGRNSVHDVYPKILEGL